MVWRPTGRRPKRSTAADGRSKGDRTMTTTTTGATNPTMNTSLNESGLGKYLVFAMILVAVFFVARALTTDSAVTPPASDTPAAVQPDTNVPQ